MATMKISDEGKIHLHVKKYPTRDSDGGILFPRGFRVRMQGPGQEGFTYIGEVLYPDHDVTIDVDQSGSYAIEIAFTRNSVEDGSGVVHCILPGPWKPAGTAKVSLGLPPGIDDDGVVFVTCPDAECAEALG